ncbi:N-acetylglucosamine kinase [Actinoplanes sp. TFC3]|uniref:N-acetylglucosamine kinase n=1 Tax=Actinoplanes sp. TFC3 TaxID=1710355 RepID=UPI000832BCD8|nr:BadF/BadG/BcrA/BcrD ATPase family protein [Actinoplanes sp. TFC3]
MAGLVLGADLGATSTRILVATVAGRRLASVTGGGGNPTTHGVQRAAVELGATVRRALDGLPADEVRAVVIGAAGRATLDDPRASRAFSDSLADVGIMARPQYVGDAEVAFCSATSVPDGTVLLAGTGAMAVQIRDRRTARASDGLGWLLGDEGSSFWIGREAVRASIAAITGTGPATVLTASVAGRLLSEPVHRSALIRAVAARPPIELAALAPLVTEAEAAGDQVAAAICEDAADRLAGSVAQVREPGERTPLVFSGSLVRTPVGRRVVQRIGGEVLTPADGVVGAAWLAVRHLRSGWTESQLAHVHAVLAAR